MRICVVCQRPHPESNFCKNNYRDQCRGCRATIKRDNKRRIDRARRVEMQNRLRGEVPLAKPTKIIAEGCMLEIDAKLDELKLKRMLEDL